MSNCFCESVLRPSYTMEVNIMKKRFISLLLCLTMVFTLITLPPVPTAADDGEVWNEVYTVEDLYNIRYDLNANYKLMDDIDLTEATAIGGDYDFMGNGWDPIGSNNIYGDGEFTGIFDGCGHTITGMRIEVTNLPIEANIQGHDMHLGLFASVSGTIKNMTVEGNISITDDKEDYSIKMGSITGKLTGLIENCSAKSNLSEIIGCFSVCVGGLVGQNEGSIVNSFFEGTIINESVSILWKYDNDYSPSMYLGYGGIAGINTSGLIERCSAIVIFSMTGYCRVAKHYYYWGDSRMIYYAFNPVVSGIACGDGEINDCHAYIDAQLSIIGDNTGGVCDLQCAGISYDSEAITNCYSRGSLPEGNNSYSIGTKTCALSYYNVSNGINSVGATSLSEAQMKSQYSFVGFDFDNVWVIYPDSAYPYPQLRSNPIDTENAIESIQVTTLPSKLTFVEGESLNFSGGKIMLYYKDGHTEEKALTRSMISGFDNTRIGSQTLTVTFGRNTTTYTITILPKSMSGINVAELPAKTQYIEGLETLDLTGGSLLLNYDNGTTETIALSNATVTGFDNTVVGEQTLTATYAGFSTTFKIQIVPKSMAAIEMHTLPTKLNYLEGKEALDVTGGKLRIIYNNGTEDVIDLTADMVSGFTNAVVGTKRVAVTYNSFTTYFDVQIVAKSVASISMQQVPGKLTYIEGLEILSVAGGWVRIAYNNDTYDVIELSKDMVSGFDNKTIGTQVLTVTYGGCTTFFTVEIIAKSIASIEIAHYPDKLAYLEGKETFDVTGGRIRVVYNNGTSDELDMTEAMVTGFDNTVAGIQTLTVTYSGKTATFQVEIVAKQLVAIELNDLPAKLTYLEGKDTLNLFGGRLKLIYDNDSSTLIDLTAAMVSGFDNTRVGEQTLVVSYNGFRTTFKITVVAKSINTIALIQLPTKLTYLEGSETLNTTGGVLLLTYNNDQTEQISLTPDMVSGFDNSRAGFVMLTVTYAACTDYFEVEIVHDYIWTETGPTCTEDGYIVYVCAHCGDTYTAAGEPATGHSFGEWIIDTEPTEDTTGTKHRVCEHCGLIDEKTIPALGKAPSITVAGAEVIAGQEFDVTISLADNSGIIAMSLNVNYNTSVLELIGATEGAFAGLSYGPINTVPFVVSWEDALGGNNASNGVFVTLHFRVKANPGVDSTVISVSYDADNLFDAAFENIYFDVEAGTVSIRQYAPGDVNRDGSVNLKDYALLKQYVNGWDVDIELSVADVNADGKINLKDVALLNQYINGWDVELL